MTLGNINSVINDLLFYTGGSKVLSHVFMIASMQHKKKRDHAACMYVRGGGVVEQKMVEL
jgi:hypothetical protein